jgi:hypothetical protein
VTSSAGKRRVEWSKYVEWRHGIKISRRRRRRRRRRSKRKHNTGCVQIHSFIIFNMRVKF